jgi:hypothetical protein
MRIFDVETTSTLLERKMHKAPIVSILFALASAPESSQESSAPTDDDLQPESVVDGAVDVPVDGNREPVAAISAEDNIKEPGTPDSSSDGREKRNTRLLLFTASLDGTVVVYDVENSFSYLKTLRIVSGPTDSIRMAVNLDCSLLAVAAATVSTIVVYDTKELTALYRGGHLASVTMANPSQLLAASMAVKSPQGASPFSANVGAAGVDPMAATIGTLTVSPAAVGGANSLGSSESAPVTGLAFCEDRPGGALLVSTDKHVVSLPLDLESGSGSGSGLGTYNSTLGSRGSSGGGKRRRRSAWYGRLWL